MGIQGLGFMCVHAGMCGAGRLMRVHACMGLAMLHDELHRCDLACALAAALVDLRGSSRESSSFLVGCPWFLCAFEFA